MSLENIMILIINGRARKLIMNVVFLNKSSNSSILFSLYSLLIAGANIVFKLLIRNKVTPDIDSNILYTPIYLGGKIRLRIKDNDWLAKKVTNEFAYIFFA
tara:strand:+ start:151 stop:453 length:303 start_codon:yes stop_codon:yes gene_type:complete